MSRVTDKYRLLVEPLEDRRMLDATRFAVIGDYGWDGSHLQEVAGLVDSWNPDFVVTTGDNNYDYGRASTIDANIGKYFQKYIGDYQGDHGSGAAENRFFPALGNHDWRTTVDGLPQPYLDYFTLPGNERYYDFRVGPVQFFILDSNGSEPDGSASDSLQAHWLQQSLASSDALWKFVVSHYAPYSSGNVHHSTASAQWPYAEWGADAVFSGHEHTYERVLSDGLPYFVDGLGGRSLYSFTSNVPGSEARFSADYGAMLVEGDDGTATFGFYTVDPAGQLVDSYRLYKEPVQSETLIAPGASWRYLDNGQTAPLGWTSPWFDDSAWQSGIAELGYGDEDEATTVLYGGDPQEKAITTYFRQSFDVPVPGRYTDVALDLLRDDGAVVYLNGEEVWRSNMPDGPITPQTLATHSISAGTTSRDGEEGSRYRIVLDAGLLRTGQNVVAVEVHQSSASSSDVSFDLSLTGIRTIDDQPPAVAEVQLDSTQWTRPFREALGGPGAGYSIPGGALQFQPAPWTTVDKVRIRFTEPVLVGRDDLSVTGVNTPQYAIGHFAYDSYSNTAIWQFAEPFRADVLSLDLSPLVEDLQGNRLDGEWTDGVSMFPSGNGEVGTDDAFQFRFQVLPGDADADGQVTRDDVLPVLRGAGTTPGNLRYQTRDDVTGDARVSLSDVRAILSLTTSNLPAISGGGSTSPLAATDAVFERLGQSEARASVSADRETVAEPSAGLFDSSRIYSVRRTTGERSPWRTAAVDKFSQTRSGWFEP